MSPSLRSLERASRLLATSSPEDAYLIVKIAPVTGGCCCFHCLPMMWREVNASISPFGPIEDDGDALVSDELGLVLECHESGPEIVAYLEAVAAGLGLATAIIVLVRTLLKGMEKDRRGSARTRVALRRWAGGEMEWEQSVELNLPMSDKDLAIIKSNLLEALAQTTQRDTPGSPEQRG